MADLHAELSALRVEWPATPELADSVLERLEATPARPRRGPAWRPVLAYALAALNSVEVERREPTAPPPAPGTLGSGLGLGTPVSLQQARERSPFLRLPTADGLGEPDAVYLGGDSVSLVYGARAGYARADATGAALLVQEFPARVGPFIEKTVGQAARLERLTVDGSPAYFIEGAHGFAYEHEGGVNFEDQRLAGNTLLVERSDGLLLRVEGELSRDQALAIARSVP
jgi:hypothetical protein